LRATHAFELLRARRCDAVQPGPARPGLIPAILATASFIAVRDLYITNVPSKPGPDSPQQPKTVADHILGFLNGCPPCNHPELEGLTEP
jgi:hypothetical protein